MGSPQPAPAPARAISACSLTASLPGCSYLPGQRRGGEVTPGQGGRGGQGHLAWVADADSAPLLEASPGETLLPGEGYTVSV